MRKSGEKIQRMRDALAHRRPDRVPVGEFFWTGFLNQYRRRLGDDFDPYRHFDLDYLVITPNMDPKIQPFEVLAETDTDVTVRTGFGATIRRSGDAPMPRYEAFSVGVPDEMAEFDFDDPADRRRFYSGGDDQINGVGDALARDLPSSATCPPGTSGSAPTPTISPCSGRSASRTSICGGSSARKTRSTG